MKEYVLQFLSQHEDEHGWPSNLTAKDWSIGAEDPCANHHTIGSITPLSTFESESPKLSKQHENLAYSVLTTLLSCRFGKYFLKHLVLSYLKISYSCAEEHAWDFLQATVHYNTYIIK